MEAILGDMSLVSVLAVAALAIVGSVIQTVCGFGFGIFVMILLPYFMPSYSAALALSGALSFTITLVISIKQRKSIQIKNILLPLAAYMFVATFAVQFSIFGSQETLKGLLGVLLVVLSIYFMRFSGNFKIEANPKTGTIAGSLGGLLSGLFGMGGPPMVLYFLAATPNTAVYLATSQFFFTVTNGYGSLIRAINGSYTPYVILMWVICLISLYIGNKIGNLLISKINEHSLRKIVYVYMGISGAIIAVTSLL